MTTDPARRVRRLQLTRAAHWFAAAQGDPYGKILRATDDDPDACTAYEEEIRARGPLFRSELLDTWATAHRAVADELAAHPDFDAPAAQDAPVPSAALALDRAACERLRPLTAFGGPLLWAPDEECVERRAERYARELLTTLGDAFDVVDDYAVPVAVRTVAEQFGLPADAYEPFAGALAGCRHALDGLFAPQPYDTERAGQHAESELTRLLETHLCEPDEDRVRAARAVAVATACTAPVLVAGAVRVLGDAPGQWELLAGRPDLAPRAVEETLRRTPPVRLEARTARTDTTLAGVALPAGARVVVLVAAVDRDPSAPHGAVHLQRAPRGGEPAPFALPGDLYFALAGPLVRSTARGALRALAEAAPRLTVAPATAVRRRSPVLRAPAAMPAVRGELVCAS
ncbi:cytochrome P450 [Streptomyces sp. NPDC049837]|uniref:cytochrome P450 n=1 Tax=Streptomyces sp. NPDC049837 TaxID=3155277 RepID=UPI0034396646